MDKDKMIKVITGSALVAILSGLLLIYGGFGGSVKVGLIYVYGGVFAVVASRVWLAASALWRSSP